jgi:hypothetical protein
MRAEIEFLEELITRCSLLRKTEGRNSVNYIRHILLLFIIFFFAFITFVFTKRKLNISCFFVKFQSCMYTRYGEKCLSPHFYYFNFHLNKTLHEFAIHFVCM